jgi:hypothetical protein
VKSIGGNGGGLIMLTAEKGGITLPSANIITEVRLKRGGLPARKFTFVSGNLSEAGSNYASTVIGYQLVTDAGCSNIVYLKVKAIYSTTIDRKGVIDGKLRFSWGLLPQK